MRPLLRSLQVLSVLELLSIGVLLINAGTTHLRPVTLVMGPTHGALYLAVAVIALFGARLRLRTRLCAVIPVLGGILTVLNVRTEQRDDVDIRMPLEPSHDRPAN